MTRYRTANLAYQIGGDQELLKWLARDADVLGLVECRDRWNRPIDVAKILGPDWHVEQDLSTSARAGSVIAVRWDSEVECRWSRLQRVSLPSRKGAGVQARYRRVAHLEDNGVPTRFAVQHNPLKSTGQQDDAMSNTRGWVKRLRKRMAARRVKGTRPFRWMLVGDGNMRPRVLAEHLNAPNWAGADVMFAVWSHGFGDAHCTVDRNAPHSDHAVLTVHTKE